jgi:hypothetical protein
MAFAGNSFPIVPNAFESSLIAVFNRRRELFANLLLHFMKNMLYFSGKGH